MNPRINIKPHTMHFIKYCFFLTLIVLSALPIAAQNSLTFDMQSFRKENDSLVIDYQIWAPKQTIEEGQGLRISPTVQAGDSLLLLPRITILGKNKHKVLARYHNNSGLGYAPFSITPDDDKIPYSYNIRVPYQLWMDSARICLRKEVSGYRGKRVVTRYFLSDKIELEAKEPYQAEIQESIYEGSEAGLISVKTTKR